MSNTQTSGVNYGLASMSVNIEDTAHLSNYFVVSELPDVLSSGKTLFSINGSELLKPNSPILLEILDVRGNPLYYELAKSGYYNYKNVTDLAVSITVNQFTESGMGQIILVGTTVAGQSVRWSTNIKIDSSLENHSKVIFYNTPQIETAQSVVYILSEALKSSSVSITASTGNVYGYPSVPTAYADINTINPKRTNVVYTLVTTDSNVSFTSENLNTPITLNVDLISYLNGSNVITQSVDITQSYKITEVLNSSSVNIDTPFTYYSNNINQVVPIGHAWFKNDYLNTVYLTGSQAENQTVTQKKKIFQYTPSNAGPVWIKDGYMEVSYKDIKTFTGKIYRHKIYRRSLNKASDFECIADEPLESINILRDSITVNRFYDSLGKYYNANHIQRYYYTNSANIQMSYDPSEILDSMVIHCSPQLSGGPSLAQYIIVKNDSNTATSMSYKSAYVPYVESQVVAKSGVSYDSNFLRFFPNSTYLAQANLDIISATSSLESRLTIYLTGSYNLDLAKQDPMYIQGIGLKLAEFVVPAGQSSKSFNSISDGFIFTTINDYRGTVVIVPTNILTARMSDFNISTYSDVGVSPDVYTIRVPFNVTIRNEQFELKFEFFDVNFNLIYSQILQVVGFDQTGATLAKYIPNYIPYDQSSSIDVLDVGPIVFNNSNITAPYFTASTSSVGFFGTASYALNSSGSGGSTLITGSTYPITSSWSNDSISSSYALTSSYAANVPTSVPTASYAYTSSIAIDSISSSYALSASWAPAPSALITGSTYPITSSWSNDSISSSYALTASYASNVPTSVPTASYAYTSSVAIDSISSSYALSASWAPAPPALITGSTYPITASWSNDSVSALTASSINFVPDLANTASYNLSSSHSLSSDNAISALTASSINFVPVTASYSNNSTSASYSLNSTTSQTASYNISSSHSLNSDNATSASYANNALSASYASTATTASYALNALSASFSVDSTTAQTSSYNLSSSHSLNSDNSISSSYTLNATSASYAVSASWAPAPPALITGSTYPITSSWSNNSISSSYTLSGSYSNNSTSASYALSSSYSLNSTTASYANNATSSSYALTSTTASYVSGVVSSITGTSPISASGTSAITISITNALADGSTKGAAAFTGSNFVTASAGIINTIQNIHTTANVQHATLGLGVAPTTALLQIKAGTATAGTAPIKLASGTLLTAAEVGAIEFLTDTPYFTISTGTARKAIVLDDVGLTAGRLPYVTTNGRLTNSALFTYTSAVNLSLQSGVASVVTQTIKGAAAQTADNLQIQDSSANVLAKIDANGSGFFSGTGQSIIQTGMVVNQSLDATSSAPFIVNGSTGTVIEVRPSIGQALGFYGVTPIVRPTALTTQLTTITASAPGTPDYAIQDLTQTLPYGFASADEGQSVLKVIANLQTRVAELETKLQALGLLT